MHDIEHDTQADVLVGNQHAPHTRLRPACMQMPAQVGLQSRGRRTIGPRCAGGLLQQATALSVDKQFRKYLEHT